MLEVYVDGRPLPFASVPTYLGVKMIEYCVPVWCRISHTHMLDSELNCAMHIITGFLKNVWTIEGSGAKPQPLMILVQFCVKKRKLLGHVKSACYV